MKTRNPKGRPRQPRGISMSSVRIADKIAAAGKQAVRRALFSYARRELSRPERRGVCES